MNRRNLDIDRRCRRLKDGQRGQGPVAYWISRDQRVGDNWSLLWAQQQAMVLVRRELSDNFCLYEPSYDSFAGFPEWARKTLDQHRNDQREYIYTFQDLELGNTHERLWNVCQLDLV